MYSDYLIRPTSEESTDVMYSALVLDKSMDVMRSAWHEFLVCTCRYNVMKGLLLQINQQWDIYNNPLLNMYINSRLLLCWVLVSVLVCVWLLVLGFSVYLCMSVYTRQSQTFTNTYSNHTHPFFTCSFTSACDQVLIHKHFIIFARNYAHFHASYVHKCFHFHA